MENKDNKTLDRRIGLSILFLFFLTSVINITIVWVGIPDKEYIPIFNWLHTLVDTSVYTNIILIILCYRFKYCYYLRVASFGLAAMTASTIVFMLTGTAYNLDYPLTTTITIGGFVTLTAILLYKKL